MKTFGKTSFGFAAVAAAQRNVNSAPELVATSCLGSFRITPPVSKALNLSHGENIMFVTTASQVEEAIISKMPELVQYCEENGLDINSPEAAAAIHAEFDTWGIAKGIALFDAKGLAKTTTQRLTKNDKIKLVELNFEQYVSDIAANGSEEMKEYLAAEGRTEEEIKEWLTQFVSGDTLQKYSGSKTSNPAGTTGAGVSLTFSDTNVWNQIKVGLSAEEALKLNRAYAVDIDAPVITKIDNGHEIVDVKVFPLVSFEDVAPKPVGSKSEEAAAE